MFEIYLRMTLSHNRPLVRRIVIHSLGGRPLSDSPPVHFTVLVVLWACCERVFPCELIWETLILHTCVVTE